MSFILASIRLYQTREGLPGGSPFSCPLGLPPSRDAEGSADPVDEALRVVGDEFANPGFAIDFAEDLGVLVATPQEFRFRLTRTGDTAVAEDLELAVQRVVNSLDHFRASFRVGASGAGRGW